jgi:hypothetical protein
MMMALYPNYTFKIEVKDGAPAQPIMQGGMVGMVGVNPASTAPPKWHKPFEGKTGCDDLLNEIKKALAAAGITATVTLDKFEFRA